MSFAPPPLASSPLFSLTSFGSFGVSGLGVWGGFWGECLSCAPLQVYALHRRSPQHAQAQEVFSCCLLAVV